MKLHCNNISEMIVEAVGGKLLLHETKETVITWCQIWATGGRLMKTSQRSFTKFLECVKRCAGEHRSLIKNKQEALTLLRNLFQMARTVRDEFKLLKKISAHKNHIAARTSHLAGFST
ncbi:hypothetical protein AVEN_238852-1 [Araneus ventricosus]|uniref:Uncharacterized protein n=1 Tax=Araneus ventricosus TaxID=182803 RepID=A0A4Y2EKQ4_ARAVE|nr:hypothetical protein AVEN_238852-1 [Araneus ventricosus]